jgi:aminoglycoside phosphotransferase family enzyme/predicted kinase
MHDRDRFDAICRAMADPAFYPHPVSHVERRDTHISAVFLTGKWVYKIKKPVDFGFLDFTRLSERRRICRREVILNRRFSRGVYQAVVPIHRCHPKGFALSGGGAPVEFAVQMRQLPDAASLAALLQKNRVHPEDMRLLGATLARLHAGAKRSAAIDRYGRPEVIFYNMEENFRQLTPEVEEFVPREHWEFIRQVGRTFLEDHRALFARRLREGRICDGHGDLRSEHIYFDPEVQLIDCIEFNDRFRYGDAALDLAFLHMDLEHAGRPALSRILLETYAGTAGDAGLFALLDFYAAYRAIVRLKTTVFLHRESGATQRAGLRFEIRRYAQQALRYALLFGRPALWIMCGLSASGKSRLSARLSEALDIAHLQSDKIRRKTAGDALPPRPVAYGSGAYGPEQRQRVYSRLLLQAQEVLRGGRSVILDATFARAKWRSEARQLALDTGSFFIPVETVCAPDVIRRRLKRREAKKTLSDARDVHLEAQRREFEAPTEIPLQERIRIDTSAGSDRKIFELLREAQRLKAEVVDRLTDGGN